MNKASGGDGIPVEQFQILKDDALKVWHSICQQVWKTHSGHRTGKGQFSFQCQRKAMPKNVQTTAQLHSFHMLARSCWKSSKIGFNRIWTGNFQIFKLDFKKAKEPQIKLPTSSGLSKKQQNTRKTKHLFLLYWLCQSLWLCGSQQTGKFFKRWEY